MSYDINLVDENGKAIQLKDKHHITGGTYAVGGTREAWLNVTYNYMRHFNRVFEGNKGIRTIYGMKAKDSIPILQKAANQLKGNTDPDYWKSTEGNAKIALLDLIELAKLCPEGAWNGD